MTSLMTSFTPTPRNSIVTALSSRPLAVDLFAGVGGLSLGLELAGFFVASFVEIDDTASRYHEYNFPGSVGFCGTKQGNVRGVTGEDILSRLPHRDVTLVAGGPPCQGFSFAGKKNPNDPLNDLVLEMARIVLEIRPKAFLIENVPGIKSGQIWQLDEAMRRLSMEYTVSEPTTLYAPDYGVPQNRKRVFVMGIRRDLERLPKMPAPTHQREGRKQRGQMLIEAKVAPTVRDALDDLPDVDLFESLINGDEVQYTGDPRSEYQQLMRGSNLARSRGYHVAWDDTLVTNSRRTRHGDDLSARLGALLPGKSDPVSGIKRLHPDELSVTIRAGTTSERGSWSAPRPCHYRFARVLTTRECARLQSFPDWFRFHPVKWHGNRQVGNAVPPLLAKAVGEGVLSSLGIPPAQEAVSIPTYVRYSELIAADIQGAVESGLDQRHITHQVVGTRQRPEGEPRRGRAKKQETLYASGALGFPA